MRRGIWGEDGRAAGLLDEICGECGVGCWCAEGHGRDRLKQLGDARSKGWPRGTRGERRSCAEGVGGDARRHADEGRMW